MRRLALFAGAAAAAFAPLPLTPAHAWGKDGHRIVCAIAYRNLTATAKAEVDRLIAADGRYQSFADSCTWADGFAQVNLRGGEHYANYERDTEHVTSGSCPDDDEPCVLSAIEADTQTLRNPGSDADRAQALKYLGHWYGDIHQPLHISFKDDRGGNYIRVTGACAPVKIRKLHAAWDSCIIQERILDSRGDDEVAQADSTAATLDAGITPSQRSAWLTSEPKDWAEESYSIARAPWVRYCILRGTTCRYSAAKTVYSGGKKGKQRSEALTAAYVNRAAPIVAERLSRGGIRLADALNRALDRDYRRQG